MCIKMMLGCDHSSGIKRGHYVHLLFRISWQIPCATGLNGFLELCFILAKLEVSYAFGEKELGKFRRTVNIP